MVGSDDAVADEFTSFLFWRQPLPSIDPDDIATVLTSKGHLTSEDGDNVDDGLVADFDEFNYWRVPIPQLDIGDLLRCLQQL